MADLVVKKRRVPLSIINEEVATNVNRAESVAFVAKRRKESLFSINKSRTLGSGRE